MIVEAVLNVVFLVIKAVISLFPTIPTIQTSGLDGVFQTLSLLDTFIDLRVLSTCLVLLFVFANAHVIWSVIMWVVRKIPGIS